MDHIILVTQFKQNILFFLIFYVVMYHCFAILCLDRTIDFHLKNGYLVNIKIVKTLYCSLDKYN